MTKRQVRIGLIACCKAKLAARARAKQLYNSDLFKKSRAYVERHCDAWAILSAKHGLIMPDDEIEPYEKTLNEMPSAERLAWAKNVEGQLRDRFGDEVTLVVIAGKRYGNDARPCPTATSRAQRPSQNGSEQLASSASGMPAHPL